MPVARLRSSSCAIREVFDTAGDPACWVAAVLLLKERIKSQLDVMAVGRGCNLPSGHLLALASALLTSWPAEAEHRRKSEMQTSAHDRQAKVMLKPHHQPSDTLPSGLPPAVDQESAGSKALLVPAHLILAWCARPDGHRRRKPKAQNPARGQISGLG